MTTVFFWVIMQQIVVISYWMFHDCLLVPSLMMGPTGSPKTLVSNYHYLLHNNPEECSSQRKPKP